MICLDNRRACTHIEAQSDNKINELSPQGVTVSVALSDQFVVTLLYMIKKHLS